MENKFENFFRFEYKILFVYIFYKIYYITVFPGVDFLHSIVFYLDLLILVPFIVYNFNFDNFFEFKINFYNLPIFFLYLTLFFFLFSSFIVNNSFISFNAFLKIIVYIVLFYSFFYKFSKILFKSDELFEKFLNIIIIFACISSFFSFCSVFFGFNSEGRFYGTTIGFFINPNSTAFVYSFAIPVIIYKFMTKRINNILFFIILLIFLYCLVFTLSRAGFIAVLISILFITFSKSKKLFIVISLILLVILSSYINELLSLKTDSSLARGLLFLTAISIITSTTQTFLFGYGVTNAITVFEEEKKSFGNFEVTVNNPHNFILLIMIQYGLLTLLPYLFFIFSLIIAGIKNRIKIPEIKDKRKLELCIAIVLGLLAQNLFEEIIVVPEFPVMSVTLIFMGIIYCFIIKGKRKQVEFE